MVEVSKTFEGRISGCGVMPRLFSGGLVDGFDQGDAAAALGAITDGGAIFADGGKEILEDGLVAANVGDGGGRGAEVGVGGCTQVEVGRGSTEVGGDDGVMLENDGAFGAGDFEAAGVAGISGGGG